MSDNKGSETVTRLTPDQAQSIGGGECTPQDYITLAGNLTQAYESLVGFTSHVIERISNAT